VHDAITRGNHIDVIECGLGPFDEMKAIFVTAIFDDTVFLKRIGIKTSRLDGQ